MSLLSWALCVRSERSWMQVQSNVMPHLSNNALNCVTMHFGCKYTCLYVEKKVSPFSSYPTAITRDTKLAPLRSITEIYGNQPLQQTLGDVATRRMSYLEDYFCLQADYCFWYLRLQCRLSQFCSLLPP